MDTIDWQSLNWLDILLGGTVAISVLVGLARGFLRSVLSILAWAVALYCAYAFSDLVAANYVSKAINDKTISYLASFGLVFLTVLFIAGLFNLLLSLALKMAGLGFTDRILGMILGFVRGMIIGALMVFMISFVGDPNDFHAWQTSQLKRYFVPIANWGLDHLPKQIKDRINVRNDPSAGVLKHNGDNIQLESLKNNDASNANAANAPLKLESESDIPELNSNNRGEVEVHETDKNPPVNRSDDKQAPIILESTK